MRCALVSLVTLLTLAPPARAEGVYGGFGFGGFAQVDGKLADRIDTGGHVGGRIVAGYRFDPHISLEGAMFGTDFNDRVGGGVGSTFAFGADLKLHLPIHRGLEAYARAGLNRTTVTGSLGEYGGPGTAYGGGIQYGFHERVGRAPFSIVVWLDWNRQSLTLEGPGGKIPGRLTMVNLGLFFAHSF